MSSKKHEKILEYYISHFRDKGFKVIRLDKRGVPDAILVNDAGEVSALLIETEVFSDKISEVKRGKKNYSQFDKEIWIIPKSKKGHDPEDYYRVLNLAKQGMNKFRISQLTGYSYALVYDWVMGKSKPTSVKALERKGSKEEIIFYLNT